MNTKNKHSRANELLSAVQIRFASFSKKNLYYYPDECSFDECRSRSIRSKKESYQRKIFVTNYLSK